MLIFTVFLYYCLFLIVSQFSQKKFRSSLKTNLGTKNKKYLEGRNLNFTQFSAWNKQILYCMLDIYFTLRQAQPRFHSTMNVWVWCERLNFFTLGVAYVYKSFEFSFKLIWKLVGLDWTKFVRSFVEINQPVFYLTWINLLNQITF